MCTIYYVPAACRERCTTDWSISESFSSLVLNGTQTFVRQIDDIVPCMIILRRFRCLPCPIRPSNGSFLCFEHVLIIGGRFRSVFWGFSSSTHDSSRHSGTGFLTSWSRRRHDCHAIRLFHDVIAYSHAQHHLSISRGFCLLAFRPMHLANIDWFSSCR